MVKAARTHKVKVIDELHSIRCASGIGSIRLEAWQDEAARVVKYNFAFINHMLCSTDNGRVLGYDNAHGSHQRHFKGAIEEVAFFNYEAHFERFIAEVESLRREKT